MYHGDISSSADTVGVADCPYDFYRNWVLNSEETRETVEAITRKSVGTAERPIPGLPHDAEAVV